ncbi:PaaI family thioesterase [Chondrinema litorale]|uniref:PaaI family thioesterase n=1 Tax=Chondrinema litorale TaxID=2994555 RepID=UPI002542BA65|nr:PaaI family thioesterase [Chondrinema litorale]UZR95614.1 PaaI family thioesterase [Chondrinema litorale]
MEYFQDYMKSNVCFGCGIENEEGLQIKSYWEDNLSICKWQPEEKYHGWANLLNGGIIATLIDCHCMCTAMAAAYKYEERGLDSLPEYRYATGTITVKYLKPTSCEKEVLLKAKVLELKNKKVVMQCDVFSEGEKTAEAEVIAIKVYNSAEDQSKNPFK